MKPTVAVAAIAVLSPAIAYACEDYQSMAADKVPASIAQAPAASKAPVTLEKKIVANGSKSKQVASKPAPATDSKQVVAARKE